MINRKDIKRVIKIGIVILVAGIILTYTFYTFKDYISGPNIIITEPENGATIASSTVPIKGQVLRIQEVTLNNRPINIDKQGNFNETLLLFPGYNVALFSAKDRFGRTIEYKLELVYKN